MKNPIDQLKETYILSEAAANALWRFASPYATDQHLCDGFLELRRRGFVHDVTDSHGLLWSRLTQFGALALLNVGAVDFMECLYGRGPYRPGGPKMDERFL